MRININDPVAKKIQVVLVDGKRVAQAIALDTEAGWVDVMVPRVTNSTEVKSANHKDGSGGTRFKIQEVFVPEFEWEQKRIFGKVEVIMIPEKNHG